MGNQENNTEQMLMNPRQSPSSPDETVSKLAIRMVAIPRNAPVLKTTTKVIDGLNSSQLKEAAS